MIELIPPDLTVLDRVALSWFLLTWQGYGLAINAIPWGSSITPRMNDVRRTWMHTMLGRDYRMTDASLIGHTVHSATFLASTTMVALASLLGAAPLKPHALARDRIAEPIAAVLPLAIRSFNAGVRGYLFALAVLAWLLGLGAFLLTITGMVSMLLWRQFGSATAVAIRHSHAAVVSTPLRQPMTDPVDAGPASSVNGPGRLLAMRMLP